MKAYVTGATGFIGTHLVRLMATTDHELTCLVRETSDVSTLDELHIPYVLGDVTDRASLERTMPGHDAVINLANVYDFWVPDKQIYYDVNVTGTRNVMLAALQAGVAKVVHVSTCLIYGNPAECPFDENCEPGPERFSAYAETKYLGTQIAWQLYEERGLPLVVVYPAGVIGSEDDKATGRYLTGLAKGRLPATVFPQSLLTFVHVQDVAQAILCALEKEGNIGEKYLLGGGILSFQQINTIVSQITGTRSPRMHMPDALVMLNARLLTAIADITKRPPLWDMSVDQIRTMKQGYQFHGSKAETELGITYTPLRRAIEDVLVSHGVAPQSAVP
ncbi:MAG: NAD-dependent epimerase/dehydratase family protein [Anaerolineae bacterium]|nr:NAD-dependent epimerase/dehydratase family protein [Anaerolineae bacterium]